MSKLSNRLRSARGFTLVEIVMYIVLAGLGMGVAYQSFVGQVDSYAFLAQRKATLADARYAMNRMTYELLRVETADISAISADGIYFTDQNGNNTSFKLEATGDSLAINRGTEKLLDHVQEFAIKYYDESDTELDAHEGNIASVRRIEISITTKEQGNEGDLNLTTKITPREYIYANYQ